MKSLPSIHCSNPLEEAQHILELSYPHPPLPPLQSLSIAHSPTAHAREALFNEILVLVHESTEAVKLAERTAYKINRLFYQARVADQLHHDKKYSKKYPHRNYMGATTEALQKQNVRWW